MRFCHQTREDTGVIALIKQLWKSLIQVEVQAQAVELPVIAI
jgi:hypothetical protein